MINYYYKKIIIILILLNFCSIGFAFFLSNAISFPDWVTYWLMSEGLEIGRFSSVYFLDTYYPETIRTPGYPFFLMILKSIIDTKTFIKLFQLALYFASFMMAYNLVKYLSNSNKFIMIIFATMKHDY